MSWSTASTEATWTLAPSSTWMLEDQLGQDSASIEQLCPICILLMETEEGQDLFGRYMCVEILMACDGKKVTSAKGWHCEMCGAKGDGAIPEFHDKPGGEVSSTL